MLARLARPASELKPHYDAVVVGSGYGGGVAASRLARCGLHVAVLERGRELVPGEFPDDAATAMKELQVASAGRRVGAATALFDVRLGDDVHVLMGCGLGGTSLINANVCLAPDPRVFESSAWPQQVRSDRLLAEGFVRARHMLRPAPASETLALEKVRALNLAATAFERTVQPVPLHVAYDDGPNAAGVFQAACTRCGDCCAGCNVGAKTTVASTYLADADALGAQIFTEMRVSSVTKSPQGRWRIALRPAHWAESGPNKMSLTADIVVLAAGTLGSTEILLRSQREGLALSSWLGSRFTSNGDAIAHAYDNDVSVNGVGVGNPAKADVAPVGQAVNALLDLRDRSDVHDGLAIVECALPSAFAPFLPTLLATGSAVFAEGEEGASLSDRLKDIAHAGASVWKGVYDGAVHNTQTFLAVGHDAGNGVMRLDGDHIAIEWTNGPHQAVFRSIEATLKTAAQATGGTYLRNPASERILGGNLMTVHPLGGCAMGEDRSSGVVNHKGQVFDAGASDDAAAVHAGLYVCDGAVIPCPLGIHPLLTITALSERAMLLLAADYGLDMKEEPAPLRTETVAHASTDPLPRRWPFAPWFRRHRAPASPAAGG